METRCGRAGTPYQSQDGRAIVQLCPRSVQCGSPQLLPPSFPADFIKVLGNLPLRPLRARKRPDTFWNTMTTPDRITPQPSYQETVTLLAQELVARLTGFPGQRYMLGITGGPGAGKSTFADSLCDELNALTGTETALVVPMDGFHKTNAELHTLGMWEQKGEPETFDSAAFVSLLSRIRNCPHDVSSAPRFDRTTDEPVPDALHIHPSHTFIIVEGNYLLLPAAPWRDIPGILDDVWHLEAPQDVVIKRLKERHRLRGLSGADLDRKIALSDLKNAHRIARCKQFAGRILTLPARH